jgi:hypothetical protein
MPTKDGRFVPIDADIEQLLSFCKAWDELGWAVKAQLEQITEGKFDDINPSAYRMIREKLYTYNPEIDAKLDEFDRYLKDECSRCGRPGTDEVHDRNSTNYDHEHNESEEDEDERTGDRVIDHEDSTHAAYEDFRRQGSEVEVEIDPDLLAASQDD